MNVEQVKTGIKECQFFFVKNMAFIIWLIELGSCFLYSQDKTKGEKL